MIRLNQGAITAVLQGSLPSLDTGLELGAERQPESFQLSQEIEELRKEEKRCDPSRHAGRTETVLLLGAETVSGKQQKQEDLMEGGTY